MKKFIVLIILIQSGILNSQSFKHMTYVIPKMEKSSSFQIEVNGKKKDAYKTVNSVLYNILTDELNNLNDSRESKLDDLAAADIDSAQPIINEIEAIKRNIKRNESKRDSVLSRYQIERLKKEKFNILLGRLKSRAFFDLVYDTSSTRFNTLNNSGLNISNNSGSIYSELASGNIGLIRADFGVMIANNTSDSTEIIKREEALQRLQSSGGNAVLKVEYPFMYIHSSQGYFTFITRFTSKWSADFPQLGTVTEDFAGSGSFGIDIYSDIALLNNSLRVFTKFDYAHYFGTKDFYTNLGINEDSFGYGQLVLGLDVNQQIQFSFSVKSVSSNESLERPRILFGAKILY